MKILLVLLPLMAIQQAIAAPYTDNDLLYEKAMRMLEEQIQLVRNFVGEVNHAESLKDTGPIWRGISNVFTDLSGMFGSGNGRGVQFESYRMVPQPPNATELVRKAKIRMEQTRKDIIEMNNRISQLIGETFGQHSTGDDYHKNRPRDEDLPGKQRDEQIAKEEATRENGQTKPIESSSQKPNDETTFSTPEGFLRFELPVRGTISQQVLKDQLYQEEYEMVSGMSPRELGKIIKPLIVKGQVNANHGQCHIAKLLDDEKPLTIEP